MMDKFQIFLFIYMVYQFLYLVFLKAHRVNLVTAKDLAKKHDELKERKRDETYIKTGKDDKIERDFLSTYFLFIIPASIPMFLVVIVLMKYAIFNGGIAQTFSLFILGYMVIVIILQKLNGTSKLLPIGMSYAINILELIFVISGAVIYTNSL